VSRRLPRLTGWELLCLLRDRGFDVARVRGSHHFLRHPDGRATSVPVHAGETLGPGLLTRILADAGLTREDLLARV
jgi:predicted RNA binding protein YcfA (HicA-like mRNA interferase family)